MTGGILILGAGGHGKVVADILQMQGLNLRGFLDDDPQRWNSTHFNLPILGAMLDYLRFCPEGLAMGLGDNRARQQIVEKVGSESDSLWLNAIHPRAVVAASVRLGHGIVIAANAVINPDAVIGNHTIINTATTVDHDCQIGDYVHLAPGVHLAGGVQVGHGTLIGVGVTVNPYLSIGDYTIVGASAAVIRSLPPNCTAVGVPARVIK